MQSVFLRFCPPSPQKFWEIASPSTLLVVLGLLFLHAERAFPEQEGPFSRKRFGLAFFWSGHVLLAGGLCLLLGAHIAADWLYEPFFKPYYEQWRAARTPVVTEAWGQILSLCLVIAGTYAYIYSDLVVRRVGVWVSLAGATLLWAEVLSLELLHLDLGLDALIAILAGTGLVANVVHSSARSRAVRPLAALGLAMELAALALGLIVYVRAVNPDLKSVWQQEAPQRSYVAAMLLTAVACRIGAHLTADFREGEIIHIFGVCELAAQSAIVEVQAIIPQPWDRRAVSGERRFT